VAQQLATGHRVPGVVEISFRCPTRNRRQSTWPRFTLEEGVGMRSGPAGFTGGFCESFVEGARLMLAPQLVEYETLERQRA
jgi:hypothetical protein